MTGIQAHNLTSCLEWPVNSSPPSGINDDALVGDFSGSSVSQDAGGFISALLLAVRCGRLAEAHALLDTCSIHARRAETSPACNLPVEILCEIFSLCIAEHHLPPESSKSKFLYMPSSLDTRDAPWSLAQVSRRWRQIVIDYPKLWSQIGLKVFSSDEEDHQKCLYLRFLLNLQLERASAGKLFLSISCEEAYLNSERISFLIQSVFQSSQRWETLSLHLNPASYEIFDRLEGRLPSLKKICIYNASHPALPGFFTDGFRSCPSLSTLCMQPSLDDVVDMSRSSITTYSSYCEPFRNDARDLLQFVSEMSLLKTWTVGPVLPINISTNNLIRGIITFPHLEAMEVWFEGGASIIPWITTPNLTSLVTHGFWNFYSLEQFQRRSSFRLQKLTIRDEWLHVYHLILFLEAQPTILSLCLNCREAVVNGGCLLRVLADPTRGVKASNPFLPALTSLIFEADPCILSRRCPVWDESQTWDHRSALRISWNAGFANPA